MRTTVYATIIGKYKWCTKNGENKLNNRLKLDYTEPMMKPTPVTLQDKPLTEYKKYDIKRY